MSSLAVRYGAALEWLYSRTRGGGERGPERARGLLASLALTPPPLTISVVGTNGKGSTAYMIERGLAAGGLTTGRFTSPHVEEFRERISLRGEPIAREAVVRFVELAQRSAPPPGKAPAFFEWVLALALSEFGRERVEAAVLEAGVGGGSDATRAVEPVQLVAITNVNLDHVETLGGTLLKIAADKAGALRPGVPAVSAVKQPEVRALLTERARELGSPLHLLHEERESALFALPARLLRSYAGAPITQRENARLSAAALRLLGAKEPAIIEALTAPPLPARGERFLIEWPEPAASAGTVPAPRGGSSRIELLLDGAHDPWAASRLLERVGERPYVLLFGALSRRSPEGMLEVLAPGARKVVITEAAPGDGATADWPGAIHELDPGAALNAALAAAAAPTAAVSVSPASPTGAPASRGVMVVVAGSLYLAGRVRPLLRRRGVRVREAWEERL